MNFGQSSGGGDSASSSASASNTFGSLGLSEGTVGLIALGLVLVVVAVLAFANRK